MSISIYQLKPRFQQLLRPFLNLLTRLGITPNQVTLGAMLLSLAYGAALALAPQRLGLWLGLPFFLLLRMALNAIDGMLANATGNKTAMGALLNELCDQVSDAALYLPVALLAGVSPHLLVLVVVFSLLAEFAGVLAGSIGVARRFDGPMGKSDRAFAFGLLAFLLGLGLIPAIWLSWAIGLVALLTAWTIINRVRAGLSQVAA